MAVNYVKFVRGSSLAFENLTSKNSDTLYFITDSDSGKGLLYLGDKLLSGGVSNITDLEDILMNTLSDGELLVYDETQDKWINKSVTDAIGLMVGATATEQGGAGLVPAPGIGQQNLFLRGDGTWALPESNGSAASQVFETVASSSGYDVQTQALAEVVGDTTLTSGDIGIVKVLIAEDTYQYTAYVYNGSAWVAMDGNYSSDSIYFDEDLVVTSPIGTITQEMIDNGGGSAVLESSNKNMTQVLASLLAEEKDPTVDLPSATYSTSSGSGEVGTTFTLPTATFKVTDVGSYTYGSTDGTTKYDSADTGVTFAIGDVVLTCGDKSLANTTTLVAGSSMSLTASGDNQYLDSAVKFVFSATANYTASADRVPVTNLGNEVEDLKIASGSVSVSNATATFTGYRKSFYGSNTSIVELNSANIRGLAQNAKSSTNSLSVTINEGARQVIIAVPEGRVVTKVADQGAFGTDIFSEFTLTSGVAVEGANGYTAKNYNVYVYAPSTALSANTYIVTVANG